MFHLSSVTVIGFDTTTKYDYMQMLYRYGDEWGFQGTLYSELFIEVYLLGVLMFSKSNTELADYDETKGTDGNSLEICRSIGLCMLAISILPQLYHDVIQIGAKIAGGYQAMFESDTTFYGIPLGWFTKLFLPAILLVLSSYRNNKRRFTIVMGITAAYFLIFMFFTGRKGNTIQTLVPLLFMYCYFFKPKLKIWYIAVAYLGIYFVTIVTHTRELAVDANFWNSLQEVIIIATFEFKQTGRYLDLSDGYLCMPGLAILGACFGIYFMFCLAKCVSTWKMAKALNSIGRNTIIYYPLTGYIPTTIDRFLTALGYDVSSQIYSVLFKLVGFIIAWGVTAVIKLKKKRVADNYE